MKELFVPHAAEDDQDSFEIGRLWIAKRALHVSLQTDQWNEHPEAWGIMLCDLARHAANAYSEQGIGTHEEIFNAIVKRFESEANKPTDVVAGEMVKKH
jgi:hypothetical protein